MGNEYVFLSILFYLIKFLLEIVLPLSLLPTIFAQPKYGYKKVIFIIGWIFTKKSVSSRSFYLIFPVAIMQINVLKTSNVKFEVSFTITYALNSHENIPTSIVIHKKSFSMSHAWANLFRSSASRQPSQTFENIVVIPQITSLPFIGHDSGMNYKKKKN